MTDMHPEDPLLDEQLAEFTDQVLNQAEAETIPTITEEEETLRLQQVIVQLKQAGLDARPDAKFSSHLRAVLQKEWLRFGPKPAVVSDPPGFFHQLKNILEKVFTLNRGREFAFGLAVVVMLLILLLLPENAPLGGAAGTKGALRPVELGMGLVCLGLLVWLLMKKNK